MHSLQFTWALNMSAGFPHWSRVYPICLTILFASLCSVNTQLFHHYTVVQCYWKDKKQ